MDKPLSTPGKPENGTPVIRPEVGHRVREGFPRQRLTVIPPTFVRQSLQLPVVKDLHVTDIGHFPRADGHYCKRPNGCRQVILIYGLAGAGWCEMGGTEWRVRPGWALFIPEGMPHSYGADREDPWTIWWAHFTGPQAAAYMRALSVSGEQPLLYAPDTTLIADAFEETYAHLQHGYSEVALLGLTTGLARLLGLLKAHQRAPHARGRSGEESIRRSIAYMREHLDRPVDVGELSERAGMSASHFSALFRKVTGSPPGHYLIHLKVRRACELLDTTPWPVSRIARDVGYEDAFHFSRIFKRVAGRSPTQYRQAAKG